MCGAVRVGGAETWHSNEVQSDTTGWIGTLELTWYVGHYFSYLPNTPKSMQPTYQPVGSPCSLSYLKGSRVWREKDPLWMDRSRPNSMSDSLFVLAKQFSLMMLADGGEGGGGERGLSSVLSLLHCFSSMLAAAAVPNGYLLIPLAPSLRRARDLD